MVTDGSFTFVVMKRKLRSPKWWRCLPLTGGSGGASLLTRGGGSASLLSGGGGGAPTSAQEEEENGQVPSHQGVSSYLFWFVSEKLVYMVMC